MTEKHSVSILFHSIAIILFELEGIVKAFLIAFSASLHNYTTCQNKDQMYREFSIFSFKTDI